MRSFFLLALPLIGACSPSAYRADADHDVSQILAEKEAERGTNEPQPVRPAQVPPPPAPGEGPVAPEPETRRLKLREALAEAVQGNRNYKSERESVYLSALALTGVRWNLLTPRFRSTIAALMADRNGLEPTTSQSGLVGVDQVLPLGGTLSAQASSSIFQDSNRGVEHPNTISSAASIVWNQPLLRGFGWEVSHEALTQAERDVVYALREFELFRQDFTIQVMASFYNLVRERQILVNSEANLDQLRYLRRQAEALFNIGRQPQLEVLRARQSELQAENDVVDARQAYQSSLDNFKILLGLATDARVDVADESPAFVPVQYDVRSSVETALGNRLELLTARDRLEDQRRAVRIARQALRPDLNLTTAYNVTTDPEPNFGLQSFSSRELTAGLRLDLPLDRRSERNAYRSSLISLDREQRSFDLLRDEVSRGVRETFRRLRRAEATVRIQEEIIQSEERRVRIAEIQFQAGQIPNRDVVEARQRLLDSRNAYVNSLVTYEIARVQLQRDLGLLELDEQGMWRT